MDSKTQLPSSKSVRFALAFLAIAFSFNSQSAWLPELSTDQLDAISRASMERAASIQTKRVEAGAAHPLGLQILFVEAREEKKKSVGDGMQADVFLFDYHRVQTSVDVVDVASGKLIHSRLLDTVHLPLNGAESAYATQLLRDNTVFFETLSSEYLRQFGEALSSRHNIDMKVSVWVPNSVHHSDSVCVRSRCALVSVFTADHYNFSTEPVVDLVSGEIYLDLLQ